MVGGIVRHHFDEYMGKAEVAIYSILAAMLAVTAFAAIATAGSLLWAVQHVCGYSVKDL
jgi:hypothetical protein